MNGIEQKELRSLLTEFGKKSTPIAVGLFLFDISIYSGALTGIIYFESMLVKLLFSIVAGTMISALFVLGHDAAHGAFTAHKKLNSIIGRIVFLPALHNYSLWQIAHNKMHHGNPNLKDYNSWSPMSLDEYNSLSKGRKILERLFRTPLGFAPYYLTQRWWKHKFFPWGDSNNRKEHLLDFALIIGFLLTMFAATQFFTTLSGHSSTFVNFTFVAVIPFFMWNSSMGWTVYIQHTHQRIPWFKNKQDWEMHYKPDEFTPYVRFPRWFGYIFHDINEHTAHHVAPKIPCYKLFKAQKIVEQELGDRIVSERFSLCTLHRRMKECKLYDFDQHRWMNFLGDPTSDPILSSHKNSHSRAAL